MKGYLKFIIYFLVSYKKYNTLQKATGNIIVKYDMLISFANPSIVL